MRAYVALVSSRTVDSIFDQFYSLTCLSALANLVKPLASEPFAIGQFWSVQQLQTGAKLQTETVLGKRNSLVYSIEWAQSAVSL